MTRNGHRPFLAPVLGLALITVLLGGCGGVERQANVDAGDYYSAEEFKKLSKDQRAAYCDELAQAQQNLDAEMADAKERGDEALVGIPGLESQLSETSSDLSSLEGEVRALQEELDQGNTRLPMATTSGTSPGTTRSTATPSGGRVSIAPIATRSWIRI